MHCKAIPSVSTCLLYMASTRIQRAQSSYVFQFTWPVVLPAAWDIQAGHSTSLRIVTTSGRSAACSSAACSSSAFGDDPTVITKYIWISLAPSTRFSPQGFLDKSIGMFFYSVTIKNSGSCLHCFLIEVLEAPKYWALITWFYSMKYHKNNTSGISSSPISEPSLVSHIHVLTYYIISSSAYYLHI